MSLLERIPGAILSAIISDLIEIEDVISLDFAFTSHEIRGNWLKLLATIKLNALIETWEHTHASVRWIIDRKIKVQSMNFRQYTLDDDDDGDGYDLLDTTFDGIDNDQLENFNYFDSSQEDRGVEYTLSNKCLVALSRGCPNIKRIFFGFLSLIDIEALTMFSDKCSLVKSIRFFSISIADSDHFNYAVSALSKNGQNNIEDITFCNCAGISDSFFTMCAVKFPNVTAMKLHYCSNLTNSTMISIAHSYPSLTSISVNMCVGFTTNIFINILESCTHIKEIAISTIFFDDRMAISLPPKLKSLRMLPNNTGGANLTGIGLLAISRSLAHLTVLHFASLSVLDDTSAPTQTRLTSFGVLNCEHLTITGVIQVVARNPQLRILSWSPCSVRVTELFNALSQHCSGLLELTIGLNAKITDADIETLANACPNLTKLIMPGCAGLTLRCWPSICKLKRLVFLDIRGLGGVVDLPEAIVVPRRLCILI